MRRTGFSAPVQLLLWVGGASAAGAVVGAAAGVLRGDGPSRPVVLMSVLLGNVVGVTALLCSVVLFPKVRLLGPLARALVLGLALVSGAIAGTALVLYLFPLLVLSDVRRALALAAINGALALLVGGVVYAYEGLRLRLAESLREVEEVRLVQATLREEAARAELAALQARINPHFFFNTLNTIASLLEENPREAERVVHTLADLFRYTLQVSDAAPVPLRREVEFVEAYLLIEQARFGRRLRVEVRVEPEAAEAKVPGLVLQPLVENAVTHGIAPVPGGGSLSIRASCVADELRVDVVDDGAGLPADAPPGAGAGHGLANVRRRLAAFYGPRASLTLTPGASGRGTAARLSIPRDPGGSA
jgi:signal transduction histidine kinase